MILLRIIKLNKYAKWLTDAQILQLFDNLDFSREQAGNSKKTELVIPTNSDSQLTQVLKSYLLLLIFSLLHKT